MPRASATAPSGSDAEYKVHDKVLCAWANGTVHLSEIIDERAARLSGASSGSKEYYVHYTDCA